MSRFLDDCKIVPIPYLDTEYYPFMELWFCPRCREQLQEFPDHEWYCHGCRSTWIRNLTRPGWTWIVKCFADTPCCHLVGTRSSWNCPHCGDNIVYSTYTDDGTQNVSGLTCEICGGRWRVALEGDGWIRVDDDPRIRLLMGL